MASNNKSSLIDVIEQDNQCKTIQFYYDFTPNIKYEGKDRMRGLGLKILYIIDDELKKLAGITYDYT